MAKSYGVHQSAHRVGNSTMVAQATNGAHFDAHPTSLVEQRAHAFDVGVNGRADGAGLSGGFHRVES